MFGEKINTVFSTTFLALLHSPKQRTLFLEHECTTRLAVICHANIHLEDEEEGRTSLRDDDDNLWGDHFSGGFARKLGQGSSTHDVRKRRGRGSPKNETNVNKGEGGQPIRT